MHKPLTNKDKWIIAAINALLFLILSSPFMFTLTDGIARLMGLSFADSFGCPTTLGLIAHGLVFLLINRALMR